MGAFRTKRNLRAGLLRNDAAAVAGWKGPVEVNDNRQQDHRVRKRRKARAKTVVMVDAELEMQVKVDMVELKKMGSERRDVEMMDLEGELEITELEVELRDVEMEGFTSDEDVDVDMTIDPAMAAEASGLDLDAITVRNGIESPLLRLPGELRNRVYRYAVGGHVFKRDAKNRVRNTPGHRIYSVSPADFDLIFKQGLATGICRQIRAESMGFQFMYNVFDFVWSPCLLRFTELLPVSYLNAVREIKVDAAWFSLGDRHITSSISMKRELPNLKRVHVTLEMARMCGCGDDSTAEEKAMAVLRRLRCSMRGFDQLEFTFQDRNMNPMDIEHAETFIWKT